MPSPTVTIRLDAELLARIDAEASRIGGTRTSWILAIIEAGLTKPRLVGGDRREKAKRAAKGPRTAMCVHRIKPEHYCKRCDS